MSDTSRYPQAMDILTQADLLAPNQYSQEQKLGWLGELEGRIHLDVHLDTPEQLQQVWASWPGNLTVGWPHSDVYLHWLLAKIHQADGELELYQNRMESFNTSYQNYANWYIRTYDPAHNTGEEGSDGCETEVG